MLHIDFETYSPLDLEVVGPFRYAEHPETEILMIAISEDGKDPWILTNPRYCSEDAKRDIPTDFFLGKEVWAHNAYFEYALASKKLLPDFGFLPPKPEQMRCTQALCRAAGFAQGLDHAAEQLGLSQRKDPKGKALIRKFSTPDNEGNRTDPNFETDSFELFKRYCIQDVRTEVALHDKLKAFTFTGWMEEAFAFDMRLNARGFAVDMPAIENALIVIADCEKEKVGRFQQLTGVLPSQRQKVKDWLAANGVSLANMQADSIAEALETYKGNEVLSLYSDLAYSAVKKIQTMRDCACADNRVRGGLKFYGARTARWSGQLVQPQNFKKPAKEHEEHTGAFFEGVRQGLSKDSLEVLWGNPLEWLASSVRHFISGPLFDADYSAIEGRIACWLAGQEDVLEMFRQGKPLYEWMAGQIYGKAPTNVTKRERNIGKVAILGCQYGMGWEKFKATVLKFTGIEISDDEAKKAVAAYRKMLHKIVALWRAIEDAAIAAVVGRGLQRAGKLAFIKQTHEGIGYLKMILPSGRSLAYPHPKVKDGKLTFFANIKGTKWGQVDTWGGTLFENACQAIAFDLMAYGAKCAETEGFVLTNLIHDQALSEPVDGQTIEGFISQLTRLPEWAEGLPLKAEGQLQPYYTK